MSKNYCNVKKLKLLLMEGTLILACSLTGCQIEEVSTNNEVVYDYIDTENEDLIKNGIEQVLDIPGENFKLVMNNTCILDENEKWTITSDKEMLIEIHTLGLDPNTKVYIDNIHIDTTICSVYPAVDGITQDTMDDRIHNSQMKGFPISDTNEYRTINCIEGQNQTFIQGSFYGFNGYQGGTIEQKRFVESDYLKAGVTGNKINSVIDLIIDKEDGTTTCTSVYSTIGVSVCPYIKMIDKSGNYIYRYYRYDKDTGRIYPDDYDKPQNNNENNNSKSK